MESVQVLLLVLETVSQHEHRQEHLSQRWQHDLNKLVAQVVVLLRLELKLVQLLQSHQSFVLIGDEADVAALLDEIQSNESLDLD